MSFAEIFRDPRSKRVVIVPDYLVNPGRYAELPRNTAAYEKLRDSGCGLIKMPPPGTSGDSLEGWLKMTADQVEEYTNRGFRVFALGMEGISGGGIWLGELQEELRSRRVPFPKTVILSSAKSSPREILEALGPMLR